MKKVHSGTDPNVFGKTNPIKSDKNKGTMYTLEEIEEEAKYAQRKAIPWMLVIILIASGVFYLVTKLEYAHYNPYSTHSSYYMQVVFIFIAVIGSCCLPFVAYKNRKKQLEAENEEEEREQWEEHYRKMEALMEKMTQKMGEEKKTEE